jgi:hypothetical protein
MNDCHRSVRPLTGSLAASILAILTGAVVSGVATTLLVVLSGVDNPALPRRPLVIVGWLIEALGAAAIIFGIWDIVLRCLAGGNGERRP